VLRAVPEAILRRAAARGLPVLLPFALPRRFGEAGRGQAYVAALIRRAIGYHIKLARPAMSAPGTPAAWSASPAPPRWCAASRPSA